MGHLILLSSPKVQVASRVWLIHSQTLVASRTTIRSHYKRMWILSHRGLAIYIKMYLKKAKEELIMKTQIIHHAKI